MNIDFKAIFPYQPQSSMSWLLLCRMQDPGQAWDHAELDELVAMMERAATDGRFCPDPLIPISKESSEEVFRAVLAAI